ncbi:FxSxx-COOH cyclophane-containing RiPP peptide [Kitasatospora kifunensis]|uniref:FXSXX-COOH protein n=1 Tax=Kitasatospora kifunensis TaxID=58351 RepID=A0A7W7R2N1_KITKI|nr:FxSxx-COOH cyclophane-containing RiPP peptide [Kitasatospora kifunensis]MBB4924083.1 FXSXX-COOH protein [Kitasatospora kifunensis]
MAAVLDITPVDELTQPAARVPLDTLSALGADELTAALHRALPGADSGQVAVAAFNSSI